MDIEELLIENNVVMHRVLEELHLLKSQIGKPNFEVDTCTPTEALQIIGLNNPRYLTYYSKQEIGLLRRRKGGNGFLYYISECKALAEKIKAGEVVVQPIKAIYGKGDL